MTRSKFIRLLWAAILAVFAPLYLYFAVAFGFASLLQFVAMPGAPHSWVVLLSVLVGIIGGGFLITKLMTLAFPDRRLTQITNVLRNEHAQD